MDDSAARVARTRAALEAAIAEETGPSLLFTRDPEKQKEAFARLLRRAEAKVDGRADPRAKIVDRAAEHLDALGVAYEREGTGLRIRPGPTPLGAFAMELDRRYRTALVYDPIRRADHALASTSTAGVVIDDDSVINGAPTPLVMRHEVIHVQQLRAKRRGRRAPPIVASYAGTFGKESSTFVKTGTLELEPYAAELAFQLEAADGAALEARAEALERIEKSRRALMVVNVVLGGAFSDIAKDYDPDAVVIVPQDDYLFVLVVVANDQMHGMLFIEAPGPGQADEHRARVGVAIERARKQLSAHVQWLEAVDLGLRYAKSEDPDQQTRAFEALPALARLRPDARDPLVRFDRDRAISVLRNVFRPASAAR